MYNILLATHYTETPGVMDKIAGFLDRNGYKLTFSLAPLSPGSLPCKVVSGEKSISYKLPTLLQFFLEGVASAYFIRKLAGKKSAFDLAICFDPLSFFHCYAFRKRLGIRRIAYYNVDYSTSRFSNKVLNAIYGWVNVFAYRKSDYFFSVSRQFVHDIDPAGRHATKANVLSHTVNMKERSTGVVRKPNSLVYAGTLSHTVDFMDVFQALQELDKEGTSFTLDIYGMGDQLDGLKQQVAELGLDKRINFCGVVDSNVLITELLPTYQVGICPYIKKGSKVAADHMFTGSDLTTKIVEYIAAGLPVITTRLIDAFDVVKEEGFGYLVEDAEGWKEALSTYLTDAKCLRSASESAHAYAKRYDEDAVLCPIFERIFSDVAAVSSQAS